MYVIYIQTYNKQELHCQKLDNGTCMIIRYMYKWLKRVVNFKGHVMLVYVQYISNNIATDDWNIVIEQESIFRVMHHQFTMIS